MHIFTIVWQKGTQRLTFSPHKAARADTLVRPYIRVSLCFHEGLSVKNYQKWFSAIHFVELILVESLLLLFFVLFHNYNSSFCFPNFWSSRKLLPQLLQRPPLPYTIGAVVCYIDYKVCHR